jgi:aminopeptidase N
MGLRAPDGRQVAERLLLLDAAEQDFVFEGIEVPPVPSLLRGFSAPVKLHFDYSRDELMFLMTRDSDGFNRWNAAQDLFISVIQEMLTAHQQGQALVMDSRLSRAFEDVLNTAIADARGDAAQDQAMFAQLLALPSEAYLAELSDVIDVDGIHAVREQVADALAASHADLFRQLYHLCHSDAPYRADAAGIARRSLKNLALAYLMRLPDPESLDLCYEQFVRGSNMTDVDAALRLLVNSRQPGAEPLREQALADFYQQWQHESLVVNQWFTVQAVASRAGALARVQQLMKHPAFDMRNPNKVRSLIGAFCGGNPVNFHNLDGEGYRFLADQVIVLNALNPQIASRLLTPLTRWRRYGAERQALMKAELERIAAQPELSKDVYEVVSKSLL